MTGSTIRAREPLFRIAKRAERSSGQVRALKAVSIISALIAGGLFILCLGYHPISVYGTILNGAFRSGEAIRSTVRIAIPLTISALGISLAFQMRFWNIGAEGQMIMGAIFASYFALFHANWPKPLLMLVMFLAAIAGGALWGLVPAFFKARFGTNETLFTLMFNYIALNIIVFLRDGPWADPGSPGFPKIARFAKNAQLYQVFRVQIGWIIALLLVVVVTVYLSRTKQGYEISVVGGSPATARYAGMPVRFIILRTMAISGGICGIAGMTQATGSDMTLATSVAGGVGFTAIIVAWLAGLKPYGILITAVLFAVLEKGCSVMQSTYDLSSYSADILQGIILFFVLGGEFFIRFRFVMRGKGGAL